MSNAEKEYSINFPEQKKKFSLSMHYNGSNSYIYKVKESVKIYKFKENDSEINSVLNV